MARTQTIELRLPKTTLTFVQDVAADADVSENVTIRVMLAMAARPFTGQKELKPPPSPSAAPGKSPRGRARP